jgi:hypothetical protein
MTSQINPYNIDGAYPVAGQDNNSQGFRTNFTNTSTNFEFANQEITDLQNNAILKSALSGTTLDNDMGGSILYNAQTYMITQTVVPLGSVTTSANLNYEAGAYFTLDTNGSVTLTPINLPAAGVQATYSVQANVANIAHTVSFTSAGGWLNGTANTASGSGIQGVTISANTTATVSFAATGTYTFVFTTNAGGPSSSVTTLNAITPRLHPFNNSSEDLANVAAANLALTTSYFSTAAAETATLAAGVSGQIKTFAMFADTGDMVITVSNAGWKSSGTGTITFDAIGDACTLMYTNAKWFCIGNNGVTFA